MSEWETVSSPQGVYVGWGDRPGQSVTGKVIYYSETGGKDPNGNACPEVAVELTEKAHSYRKGQWQEYEPGTTVNVTCAQKSLRRDIVAARLNPGDLVKITLDRLVPTAKSPAKIFDVKVARNSAPAPTASSPSLTTSIGTPQQVVVTAPAQSGFDSEPPF